MEDEDTKCVTKIDVPVIENKSPCVPVSKEIDEASTLENNVDSPSEEVSEENIFKLKSIVNHQESANKFLETEKKECCESTNFSDNTKKLNGEVDKSECDVSSEDLNCKEPDKTVKDVLKTNEIPISEVENPNKRKHIPTAGSDEVNPSDEESENKSSCSSPVEFRGFKKRKMSETEKEKISCSDEIDKPNETETGMACEPAKPKVVELRRSARNANMAKKKIAEQPIEEKEENGDQLTEYAQYLGLQPTVKFKCGRCGEKHFQSMASLNAHQKICSKSGCNALIKPAKPLGDSNLSTNFRITRKVYLCSACGTYYENWKLFLHMRDMHKRHICLFCLGMFSVADKLAEHLLFKHNVHEKTCKSPEEFLNLFKGSCYLTCCSCEKMFTEREDFFDHQCNDLISSTSTTNKDSSSLSLKDTALRCNLCGIKCGHFQSCPNVHNKFQNVSTPSTSNNKSNTNSPSNMSLTKFYIPVPSSVQKEWSNKNVSNQTNKIPAGNSDKDDYYDVGSAASFCHVDIANDSDNQASSDKLHTEKKNSDCKANSENDSCHGSPSISTGNRGSTDEGSNTNFISNNEILSSSDESVEKNESKNLESNTTCDNEDILCKNYDSRSINNDIVQDDVNYDENDDADNKHSSSENDETSLATENINTPASSTVSKSIADNSNPENCITPCYIKLDRLEENISKNETKEDEMDIDDRVSENADSNIDSPNNTDKIDRDEISSKNSNNSPNLKLNDFHSEHATTEDQRDSEYSMNQIKNSSDAEDTINIEKENVNSDNLSTQVTSLVENGLENKEESDLLDKSDESEDSDKLSVVLSEDGSDGNEENKIEDDFSHPGKESSIKDPNSNLENVSIVENETFKSADLNNDCNNLPNGNDITDDSNNAESQANGKLSMQKENLKVDGENIQLASEEVLAMALTLEDKMDCLSSQSVIKECVRTSCTTCSYCGHAIKIGVNGRQLALHLLAEHRYMPVKNETVEDVKERLKKSLDELQDVWFNTDSYDSSDKSCFVPYDHTYECFQCNYITNLHKDLYVHYRKVHQKSILYCCMCKANFYSYSELLCHMCPGLYVSKDIQFRCCLCELDRIPSAFRLMVHLRKTHHTCDICLEVAGDQQKLSTHMWKHKLNHLCYRCGISYRNKPDITKHLFWKHGTESVLCKKCLQKKWPHVYHFCIPPTAFVCEECNLSFSKAVALKVHKRIHAGDLPHTCSTCEQKFVSKKLLAKHEKAHSEVPVEVDSKADSSPIPEDSHRNVETNLDKVDDVIATPLESSDNLPPEAEKSDENLVKQHKKKSKKDKEKKSKPIVDVYDIPPLNLSSESDDSDDEKESKSAQVNNEESEGVKEKEITQTNDSDPSNNVIIEKDDPISDLKEKNSELKTINDVTNIETGADTEENIQPVTVVDGVWDSFHSYRAEQEKRENLDSNLQPISEQDDVPPVIPNEALLGDHDYCVISGVNDATGDENTNLEKPTAREHSSSIDHDYCTLNNTDGMGASTPSNQDKTVVDSSSKKKQKSPKKKAIKHHHSSSSSDSSTDSDSSTNCSCGTNCSCSSSSSNSSSSSSSDSDSSSSEGRRHNTNINKREKKKDRLKIKRKEDNTKIVEPLGTVAAAPEEETVAELPVEPEEPLIKESDLETDETSTDEEFYDQCPQSHANQLLAEKRNQLMVLASVAPVNNGTASPVPLISEPPPISHTVSNSINLETDPPPTQVSAITTTLHPQSKRKLKSKKRKKSSQLDNRLTTKPQNLTYEAPQPSTSFSSNHSKKISVDSPFTVSSTVTATLPDRKVLENNMFLSNQSQQQTPTNTGSHSSKRLSKRRRVRNKFYGYSSEEEDEKQIHHHPPSKWKKTAPDVNVQHNIQKQQFRHLQQQQQHQQVSLPQHFQTAQPPVVPEYNFPPKMPQQPIRSMDEHKSLIVNDRLTKQPSTPKSSSSSEIDSESDTERTPVHPMVTNISGAISTSEKDDKLYCYCQCPYDEVSEMIACDGVDCAIEWFHFECVGIMVPPKGKWYCPDCRKRRGLS